MENINKKIIKLIILYIFYIKKAPNFIHLITSYTDKNLEKLTKLQNAFAAKYI
jgi:hypothetical protein